MSESVEEFNLVQRKEDEPQASEGVPSPSGDGSVPHAPVRKSSSSQKPRNLTRSVVRVMIVTNTNSETSDFANAQIPEVEEMLQILIRQNISLSSVAIIDVSHNFEQLFWVVTQTQMSYPPYPQLYVADQRFGTLRGELFFPERQHYACVMIFVCVC